eukprot:3455602-Amphidinium_carterae.2
MDLADVGRRFLKSPRVLRPSSPEGSASGTQASLMPGLVPCLGLTEVTRGCRNPPVPPGTPTLEDGTSGFRHLP